MTEDKSWIQERVPDIWSTCWMKKWRKKKKNNLHSFIAIKIGGIDKILDNRYGGKTSLRWYPWFQPSDIYTLM